MEYGWFVAAASSSSFLFPPPSFRLFLQKITCWYPLWCTYTQRITFSGTPFRGFIYGCTTGCSLCWFLGLTEIICVRAISGWFLGYPRPHTRARLFSHILLSTVAHIFMHSVSSSLCFSPLIHPGSLSASSKPFSYAPSLCLCGGITLSFVIICLLIASFKAVHMLQQKQSCRIPRPRALQHNPTPNCEAGNYSNDVQHTVHCCTERKDSHIHTKECRSTHKASKNIFFCFWFFAAMCNKLDYIIMYIVTACRRIHSQT